MTSPQLQQGDIVLVPFPFSDLSSIKTRPALVVSNKRLKGRDVILCAITSQAGSPHEVRLSNKDLSKGKLPVESFVRFNKVASLDKRIIRQVVGRVTPDKLFEVVEKLHRILKTE